MMNDIIAEAKAKKECLGFYTNEEQPTNFLCGYPLEVSKDALIVASIAPNGMYDGYIYLEKDCIFQIESNTRYIENIEQLYAFHKKTHKAIECKNDLLARSLLEFARREGYMVSVELFHLEVKDICGFVQTCSQDEVVIQLFNLDGEEDGTAVFCYETISAISCDTEDEIKMRLIHEIKKGTQSGVL